MSSTVSFKVSLVRAKGLAKFDTFGSSDPFVVVDVVDVESKKVLATQQTEVKKDNLNPEWKQSFDFKSVPADANFEVQLNMFDWDRGASENDFMGRVVLPGHVVREAGSSEWSILSRWDPLQHRQGKKGNPEPKPDKLKGKLQYIVSPCDIGFDKFSPQVLNPVDEGPSPALSPRGMGSVSTPTHQSQGSFSTPTHQSQGSFSTPAPAPVQSQASFSVPASQPSPRVVSPPAQVHSMLPTTGPATLLNFKVFVIRARDLAKFDTVGSSDPFIVLDVVDLDSNKVLFSQKTEVKKNNLNPEFKHMFDVRGIPAHANFETQINMFDHDIGLDNDFMGRVVLPGVIIRDALNSGESGIIARWDHLEQRPTKKGGVEPAKEKLKGRLHFILTNSSHTLATIPEKFFNIPDLAHTQSLSKIATRIGSHVAGEFDDHDGALRGQISAASALRFSADTQYGDPAVHDMFKKVAVAIFAWGFLWNLIF